MIDGAYINSALTAQTYLKLISYLNYQLSKPSSRNEIARMTFKKWQVSLFGVESFFFF